jgi:hypothetical protein
MLRNPELFSSRIGGVFLPMIQVSDVGHEDEEDAEHDVAEVGEDVVEVGHQTKLLSAQKIEVTKVLDGKENYFK